MSEPSPSKMDEGQRDRRSNEQHHHVLDADIRDYFGSTDHDHDMRMKLVARRVQDRRVLKPITPWLDAGVMEDGDGFCGGRTETPREGK